MYNKEKYQKFLLHFREFTNGSSAKTRKINFTNSINIKNIFLKSFPDLKSKIENVKIIQLVADRNSLLIYEHLNNAKQHKILTKCFKINKVRNLFNELEDAIKAKCVDTNALLPKSLPQSTLVRNTENVQNNLKSKYKQIKSIDYWYDSDDITNLLPKLFLKHGRSSEKVVCTYALNTIDIFFKDYLNEKFKDINPIYLCLNTGETSNYKNKDLKKLHAEPLKGCHWVAMCIYKYNDQVNIFYKDPLGDPGAIAEKKMKNILVEMISEDEFNKKTSEKNMLIENKKKYNINWVNHEGIEQLDGFSCGPLSVENLLIMDSLWINANKALKDSSNNLANSSNFLKYLFEIFRKTAFCCGEVEFIKDASEQELTFHHEVIMLRNNHYELLTQDTQALGCLEINSGVTY